MAKSENKTFSLKELAEKLGAEIDPLSAGDKFVSGFTTLEAATDNDIAFITSHKYASQAKASKAAAILAPKDFQMPGKILLRVENVWKAVIVLLGEFYPEPMPTGLCDKTALIAPGAHFGGNVTVEPLAIIKDGAQIGDNTLIGALSYIGRDVKVGCNCLLHPRVTILRNCEIGNRVILHPGVIIGSDGFKYEVIDGVPTKIPQVGHVVIEDDVEIGANTCIDRASVTETRICRGTKLDNLIQVAHNVHIGPYCLMASQVGIAGSTKIGAGCIFGGQAGIRDNINIGNKVMVAGKCGVSKDTPDGTKLIGMIGMPAREYLKNETMWRRLPKLIESLKELQKRIEHLEAKLPSENPSK